MTKVWSPAKVGRAGSLHRTVIGPAPGDPSPWEQGFAAGQQAAEAALADERAAIAALAKSLEALQPPSTRDLEAAAAQMAARLAIAAAGAAVIDRQLLEERARAAVALLSADIGATTLILNPEDSDLFAEDEFPCAIRTDETLPRGSVRAEAGNAWAADGVAEAIDRIHATVTW